MKKVIINGTEYKLDYNLRSLFVFEEITGHPYKAERTIDSYILYFAMLQANNSDFAMTFDEFIDACDKDFGIFQTFGEVMETYAKRMSAYVESKKKVVTQ